MTLPATELPTDLPTTYMSIRITRPHDMIDAVVKIFSDQPWYLIYPHVGKQDENPHFHILTPEMDKATQDSIAQRIRRAFSPLKGNALFSFSGDDSKSAIRTNGILSGIQYCTHEHSSPTLSSETLRGWIQQAPEWLPRETLAMARKSKPEKLGEPVLTLNNVVKQAIKFREQHRMETDNLATICNLMVLRHGWSVSRDIQVKGLPYHTHAIFRARLGQPVDRFDMFEPHTYRDEGIILPNPCGNPGRFPSI